MRRIWAHKISFFVPRPRDHCSPRLRPGSVFTQDFAQACSPLLRLSTIFGTLRRSMLYCFNSSRVGPELVPYIKMAKIGPHFENEQPRQYITSHHRRALASGPTQLIQWMCSAVVASKISCGTLVMLSVSTRPGPNSGTRSSFWVARISLCTIPNFELGYHVPSH